MQPAAFWRRLAMCTVWGIQLLSATSASAQVASECELRIGSRSVGGSLALPLAEANLHDVRVDSNNAGRGWSAEAAVPIVPGWGARVDYAHGHLAAVRTDSTVPSSLEQPRRQGDVTVRHLTAGVVHALSPPGMLCAYVGGGVGLYQFDYFGRRARNRGAFGLAGMEFGVGERSGLAFEIQLHAAFKDYEGALMLKPAIVFRVHF